MVILPLISHAIETSDKRTNVEIYETTAADGFCNIIIQNKCTNLHEAGSTEQIEKIRSKCRANIISYKQDATYLEGYRFILRIPCSFDETRPKSMSNH